MIGKLKHDVTLADCWPNQGGLKWPATFPAGTAVHYVRNPIGMWAITSLKLVAVLTGNSHDAAHRYVWIDAKHVEETP